MDSSSTANAPAMSNRLKVAISFLREAQTEIECLKKEKADLENRLQTMVTTVGSKWERQRAEVNVVRTQFDEARSAWDGCIANIQSNLQTHFEGTKRTVDELRYQKKLLTDQLAVKKLKFTHLSKRVDGQAKQIARLKRLNSRFNAGDGSALTMKCIRCKARKNVIKSLEQELVEMLDAKDSNESRVNAATKEKTGVELRLETTKGELTKAREQIVQLRRNNAELEHKLREEREKTLKLEEEARDALSQFQTAVIEIGRTPTDQQQAQHQSQTESSSTASTSSEPSPMPPTNQGRYEHVLAELRSQLEKRQQECNAAVADRESLRNELTFYQQRCETMTMDLENSTVACDEKQKELDAANHQLQILQALLENLATGIVTAIAD